MKYPKAFNDYWRHANNDMTVIKHHWDCEDLKRMAYRAWNNGRTYQRGRPRRVWSEERRMF